MSRLGIGAPLAVAAMLVGLPALAQGRPDTRAMTCAEAAALVAREGAVVMTTGELTYGRIVRDVGFCTIEKSTRPDYEPTRDAARCFVGYRCVAPYTEGENGR